MLNTSATRSFHIRGAVVRSLLSTIGLVASLFAWPAMAQERVDLELVLLADASRSIDDAEIHFQRRGYASAITDPQVLSAITGGGYQRIAVTYVEWGSAASQEVVVPWTVIDGPETAVTFAQRLLGPPRRAFGRNAIGSAIAAAHVMIEANAIEAERRVIDLSADSANSWSGIPIEVARQAALDAEIIINGLAVLCRSCSGRPGSYDLERAFAERIIGGPGGFF